MLQLADATQVIQDQRSITELTGQQVRFSFFLQIRFDDPDLFSLALDLLASTNADQVVLSQPCRRYVVNSFTQAMEMEPGVLISVILADILESELAVKAWAIRAAKRIGVDEFRYVAYKVYEVDMPAQSSASGFQLSFDDFSNRQ
jgi:hypothetical protein